jgi:hypothetical protein
MRRLADKIEYLVGIIRNRCPEIYVCKQRLAKYDKAGKEQNE